MWSKSDNPDWNGRAPYTNSFVLCVLESGTLLPSCSGTFATQNNTDAPSTPMFALSSGGYFTCGLSYESKKPFCWGNPNSTVPSVYRDVSYSSLSAGQGHVCALRSSGELDCWGQNTYGQLNFPQASFIQVSSGYDYTCGLVDGGEAFCWGWDRSNALFYRAQPKNVAFSVLFSGGTHTCGLEKDTGTAFCWGWNNFGQCSSYAEDVKFSSLALGLFHSCGIVKGKGNVVCWGDGAFNQTAPPKDEAFSVIAAGDYYTCGVSLNDSQRVKCWGNSVVVTGNVKVSQGLCSSQACSVQQYELSEDNSKKCPVAGDRVCLDCLQGNMKCMGAPSPSPSSLQKINKDLEKPKSTSGLAVGISVGAVIAVILAAVAGYCIWRRRAQGSFKTKAWETFANRLVAFSGSDLVRATENYRSEMIIGKGASGVVYKAVLPDGRALALKKSRAGDKSLVKELSLLARLHHAYLVNLVGYCAQEQLLAFEFMENGSLFDCLFKKPEIRLDWFLRIRIAAQAARGLEYLHIYASPQILHRDVKAANILLDKDWNAHLSDFGVSLSPSGNTTQLATMVGTPGYMDPEYFQTAKFTTQSDVYSFGVVLLELLTGCQAMLSSERSLVSWVLLQRGKSNTCSLFDPRIFLPENTAALEEVLRLALQCTSFDAEHRPTISSIASTLERVSSPVAARPDEISNGSSGTNVFTSNSWN
ncbi:putative receptor protein kinase CRINKLY4 [Selaginella moellendorffii]|uniref:putative receptor protein kinase CRINKLY4 n=1 Tax=Selaginella moellendorffii TaxID=88036 RepID=UPI000D1D0441|nr:putative receptor protein kinase CRINKLY4 [Selaginella moellendorffii]|eukprot:XP_024525697.1 putative receptor protein kinase CRINKLY4 [Selaginella moellendorffii]